MSFPGHPRRFPLNQWARRLILSCLIVLLVFLAYLPALHGGFIWDDDLHVTQNPTLRDGKGLWQIWFVIGAVPQYYPMVHTTFWLEYHLWGLNPLGFHLVNILLHALAAILLWQVLLRLQVPGAWLASIIFAIHPVEVESVVWITELKNVLSTVFYFAAALAWLRFVTLQEAVVRARVRWYWYAGALVLFMAALGSKTVTCSLPAALLLVCWWKKGRVQWKDFLPLLPFFLVGIVFGLTTAWMEKHKVGAQGTDWSYTFVERCLIAGRAVWFYAAKLAWPGQLTFIYPRWIIATDIWWEWLFPIAAAGLIAALWLARHRIGRGPLAALLFFGGTLGPALGFINVYPMRYSFVADHFQYLASVGLIALGAAALKRMPRAIPGLVVIVCGVLTWQRTHVYRDQETLWRDTLAKNPGCVMAYVNLGDYLQKEKRIEEAVELDRKAIQIDPKSYEAWNNLGIALNDEGRVDEAIEAYHKSIQIKPDFYQALNNLGLILAAHGRLDDAIENFQKAIQINPNRPDIHFCMGMAFYLTGRAREAMDQYHEALSLNPDLADALNNLAWILAASPNDGLRNGTQAVDLAERACALTHYGNPQFVGTLAAAYAEAGRFPEAVSTAKKAEQLAINARLADDAEADRQLIELFQGGKPYREPMPHRQP